jgi:hypothetical protein
MSDLQRLKLSSSSLGLLELGTFSSSYHFKSGWMGHRFRVDIAVHVEKYSHTYHTYRVRLFFLELFAPFPQFPLAFFSQTVSEIGVDNTRSIRMQIPLGMAIPPRY